MMQIHHLLPTIPPGSFHPPRANTAVAPAAVEIILLHNPMQPEEIPVLCLHYMFLNPPAAVVPQFAQIHESISIPDFRDDAFFFPRVVDCRVAFRREGVKEYARIRVEEVDDRGS